MPKTFADGDRIRVADRDATAADVKSGLFYPHYRSLSGTIGKLYSDGTASILVDDVSLPTDVRARHETGSQAMRQKWLEGLSDEARNRLSSAEKKFSLRYIILVSVDDLLPGGDSPTIPDPSPKRVQQALDISTPEPARKSLAEIEAEEARHLEEVSKKANG